MRKIAPTHRRQKGMTAVMFGSAALGIRQRGVAVVELALTLPVLMLILALIVFYGRVLYNYETAHKASRDAARYLSSAAAVNMQSPARIGHETAIAQAIAQAELEGLHPGEFNGPFISIACDGIVCFGAGLPNKVTVDIVIIVHNDLLGGYVPYLGNITLHASNTMRYVGN